MQIINLCLDLVEVSLNILIKAIGYNFLISLRVK